MAKFEIKSKEGVPVMFQNKKLRVVLGGKKPRDLAEIIQRVILKQEQTNFENSKRVQCYQSHRRSIGDTWRVAQSYIPGISYKQVEEAIQSLYDQWDETDHHKLTKLGLIHHGYCYQTGRIVHNSMNLLRATEENVRKELERSKLNLKC